MGQAVRGHVLLQPLHKLRVLGGRGSRGERGRSRVVGAWSDRAYGLVLRKALAAHRAKLTAVPAGRPFRVAAWLDEYGKLARGSPLPTMVIEVSGDLSISVRLICG